MEYSHSLPEFKSILIPPSRVPGSSHRATSLFRVSVRLIYLFHHRPPSHLHCSLHLWILCDSATPAS
ncbi:hypothetical protein RchiOBHm_Chr4g0396741 [Rosa chinensis]|uniref:Uncharacterized protein n=1 Tax=Rosa chinensis TaxID=74649 RepID=A0A2P6QRW0_ROSCH|nr:hypothetical protein RchiOBHm_Chr4g0396741 [Rosa chinensis]